MSSVNRYALTRLLTLTIMLAAAAGCGAATTSTATPPAVVPGDAAPTAAAGTQAGTRTDAARGRVVPAGYGSLRQDDITVSLRSGALLVKITPMDESTIRLLAPDTYSRLHALRESRRAEVERRMSREAELFLVSFFSYQPDQVYQPEDVQLVYQSRLLRPSAIMPVTGGWGRQRLGQQETQTAIYAFEGAIDFDQSFTVRYDQVESADWQRIVPLLETERGRVLTRSGG